MPQIPLHTFPRNFPVDGEVASLLRNCWCAKKSATSWQQVVVLEFGKRHDTTDTTDLCRANSLRTCYRETGVMDFGLNANTKETVKACEERLFARTVIGC